MTELPLPKAEDKRILSLNVLHLCKHRICGLVNVTSSLKWGLLWNLNRKHACTYLLLRNMKQKPYDEGQQVESWRMRKNVSAHAQERSLFMWRKLILSIAYTIHDSQDPAIVRAEEVLKGLQLDLDHYREVMLPTLDSKENSLNITHGSRSSIKVYPAYVTKLPFGNGSLWCSSWTLYVIFLQRKASSSL